MKNKYIEKKVLPILGILILTFIFMLISKKLIVLPYILLLIYILSDKKYYISPMFYLIIPWSFMFVVYFLELVVYNQGNTSIEAIMYLIIGNILVIIGYYTGKKIEVKRDLNLYYERETTNNDKAISIINIIALFGIIGSMLFIIEMVFVVGINSTTSSADIRHMFVNRQATILSQLGNIISWGSLVALSSVILLWSKIDKKEKVLWLTSALIYCGYSVLSSGRQIVFQVILVTISSIGIKNYSEYKNKCKEKVKNKRINRILTIVIVSMGILYCLNIASSRNDGNISDSKKVVLEYYFDCEFDKSIENFINNMPDNLRDGISEAIVYFTHQISGFTTYWNIDDSIGPFYGLYSRPFIDRRVASIGLTEYSVEEKMNYVRNYMKSQGAMNVGWKTSFSFYILDYGRFGGLLYCLLIGILAGKIIFIYLRRKSIFSALLLIRINIEMLYTIMFPASAETGLLLMGIFSLLMVVLENKDSKLYLKI